MICDSFPKIFFPKLSGLTPHYHGTGELCTVSLKSWYWFKPSSQRLAFVYTQLTNVKSDWWYQRKEEFVWACAKHTLKWRYFWWFYCLYTISEVTWTHKRHSFYQYAVFYIKHVWEISLKCVMLIMFSARDFRFSRLIRRSLSSEMLHHVVW
jgi:hypothetical protein